MSCKHLGSDREYALFKHLNIILVSPNQELVGRRTRGQEAGQPQPVLLPQSHFPKPPHEFQLFIPIPSGTHTHPRSPGLTAPRWQLKVQVSGEDPAWPCHHLLCMDEGENGAPLIALGHPSSPARKRLWGLSWGGLFWATGPLGSAEGPPWGLTPHRGSWTPTQPCPMDVQPSSDSRAQPWAAASALLRSQ